MTVLDRIKELEAGKKLDESPFGELPPVKPPAQVLRRLALYGAPGVRDPDAPCPSREFEPGTPSGDCKTDGHYMCRECVHAELCEGCNQIEARCECPPEPSWFDAADDEPDAKELP